MEYSWIRERKDSLIGKLIFYLFWPFGAWLYCLKDPRSKSSYVVYFLFALLLLWHMAPTGLNERYDDFLGILDRFQNFSMTTKAFFDEVVAFFTFSENAPRDLYQDFLSWFTKLFTSNYHFMFLLAAIPVAFFQLKSLKLVTNDGQFQPGFLGLIAMIMMILPRDMITVQNPRFATGYWLLVFCSLYCFSQRKLKIQFLLPLLLLPAIHSGLWLALIMVAVFLIIPKNRKFLEILALISIPFVFIDPNLLSSFNINLLPGNLVEWAERYTSEEAYARFILNEGRSGFWWVNSLFQNGLKVIYIALAVQVIKHNKMSAKNSEAYYFYPYFLFTFFFINMIQFIPEMGNRYYNMWRVFVFFAWYKTFHFSRRTPYLLLFLFSFWFMLNRYGYFLGGALSVNMPPDIFFTPLPWLIGKGWFW